MLATALCEPGTRADAAVVVPRRRSPAVARQVIVDATRRVLKTRGASFSLDDVAREAQVSKGGLLHHFRTREQLVEALVKRLVAEFDAKLEVEHAAERERARGEVGAWLRAYIELSFGSDDTDADLYAALASLTRSPDQHPHFVGASQRLFERIESDGLPIFRAHVVRLACDSVWLGRHSGLPGLPVDRVGALKDELIAMTRTGGDG